MTSESAETSRARLAHTTGVVPVDPTLIRRLIRAYQHSVGRGGGGGRLISRVLGSLRDSGRATVATANRGSQWNEIHARHHAFVSALERGDVDAIGLALQRPDETELFFGFEDLGRWSIAAYRSESHRSVYAQHCYELLQRLARALGVLREPNPEAVDRRVDVPFPAALASLVESAIGFSIAPPSPYPFYYGLETPHGVLGERVLNALYCAHRLRQLTTGVARPRVLEIGAGLGRLAHYAAVAGVTDYWIVDLPLTSVAQGHFLSVALGPGRVVLDGEADRAGSGDAVKILPPERFLREDLGRFDVVINVDSLTEIGRELADRYMRVVARCAGAFLSVNHEVNEFRVLDVFRAVGGFRRWQRHPYWMRQGYVEELFWN